MEGESARDSAASALRGKSAAHELGHQRIAVVTLDLYGALAHGPARTAATLEFLGQQLQFCFAER